MANKGDKAVLEPQAMRLYKDGNNLSQISSQLGVSVTSLKRWKDATKDPNQDMDEWDRARSQKSGNITRLRDLFEGQLEFIENLPAAKRSAPMLDVLSKIGSLLEKWDKLERAQKVADEVVQTVKKAGVTAETTEQIRASILGIGAS